MNTHLQPGLIEERALELSRQRKLKHSQSQSYLQIDTSSIETVFDQASEDAILKSRQEFEVNGKRDMDAALVESLQAFSTEVQNQEN